MNRTRRGLANNLDAFAVERSLTIAVACVESSATLVWPEMLRLLKDCHPGNVLLIEQVGRLSRLLAMVHNA